MVLGAQDPVGCGGNSREGQGASLGNFQLKDTFLQSSRWVAGIKLKGTISYAKDLIGAAVAVNHLSKHGTRRCFAHAHDGDLKWFDTKTEFVWTTTGYLGTHDDDLVAVFNIYMSAVQHFRFGTKPVVKIPAMLLLATLK